MSDIIAPFINGRRYSYASIEILASVGLVPQQLFLDVDEISYSEKLSIAFKNGTSAVPLGTTRGVWEGQEGSIAMGKSTFQKMVQGVGPGWLGINMVLMPTYADIGEILTVDIIPCRITGVEDAHTYGPDPLKSVLAFTVIAPVTRNAIPSMLNRVV